MISNISFLVDLQVDNKIVKWCANQSNVDNAIREAIYAKIDLDLTGNTLTEQVNRLGTMIRELKEILQGFNYAPQVVVDDMPQDVIDNVMKLG